MQKNSNKQKFFYLKIQNCVVVGNDLFSFQLGFRKRLMKKALGLKIKKKGIDHLTKGTDPGRRR
jgi:hypothetical protein